MIPKQYSRKHLSVPVFIVLIAFFSCNTPEEPSDMADPSLQAGLFELKKPAQTGLDFKTKGQILHPRDNTGLLSGGSGVAVGDINKDGLQDLFFSGGLNNSGLFLNEGNFRFSDITRSAGIVDAGPDMARTEGVNFVDINGDGWLDIYIVKSGLSGDFNSGQFSDYGANLLYISQKDNTFVEASKQYGLDLIGLSQTANFFDYDADGDLDVYLIHTPEPGAAFSFPYYNAEPGSRWLNDQFLENTGSRFVDAREKAGLLFRRNVGLSVSVADVNNDGYPDIYVANDFFGRDFFYLNNGDKTFKECLSDFFTKTPMSAMGSDFADINNDGYLDLFVGEMMPETHRRQKLNLVPFSLEIYNKLKTEGKPQYTRNMLQLNRGGKKFQDIGLLSEVHATEWSWSSFFMDADNDGFQDLFVANGIRRDMTNMDFIKSNYGEEYTNMADPEAMSKVNPDEAPVVKTQNYIFRNNGDYTFRKMNESWGMDQLVHTRGAIYADLDNDGDLDLVLNNMDEGPYLYQNKAENLPARHNLRLSLQARGKNTFGIGARVDVYCQGQRQTRFLSNQRGFQSCPEPILHFGLGKNEEVDSLIVTWPGGEHQLFTDVEANQLMKIVQGEGGRNRIASTPVKSILLKPDETPLNYTHTERTFLDYRRERLLTRQYSREGPGIAVADVNGDGLDDCFVGGAAGNSGALFLQNEQGDLVEASEEVLPLQALSEDMGAVFFHANGDTAPDLYIASGSSEFNSGAPALKDRLFMNDGQGNFTPAPEALPQQPGYSSAVTAADFDLDGDEDLFVGGRMTPGDYATVPASQLLLNEGGAFTNVISERAPELERAGRITSALWSDVDNDGDPDLAVVGEWMPFTIFYNNKGQLTPKAVAGTEGWWNSIQGADIDNDGDMDYIAGNHGLNSIFKASEEEPMTLLVSDFDNNGKKDPIVFKYTSGVNAPFANRDLFTSQMPYYNNRFYRFENYAEATLDNLFEEQKLEEAETSYAYEMRSSVFINNGNSFEMIPLPVEAQFGPVYGILSQDFNADGFLDILLCGNDDSNHYEYGSIDALGGLLLLGDGTGKFAAQDTRRSGIDITHNAKSLSWLYHASGSAWMLVGNNNGPVQTFSRPPDFEAIRIPEGATHAVAELKNGAQRKIEFYKGEGYLSQSSRHLIKDQAVQRIVFFDGKEEMK